MTPHVSPLGQVPQSIVPPQPSPMTPHSAPPVHELLGVQMPTLPHWFGATAPHTSGPEHVPQSTTPPHPLPTMPHSAPVSEQSSGSHPWHWLGTPPTFVQSSPAGQ